MAGTPLRPSDFTVFSMRLPTELKALPIRAAQALVGRRLTVTLPAGTLLVSQDIAQRTAPPPGLALVGASLQPDQAPLNLETGDSVLAIESPGSGATSPVSGSAPLDAGTVIGRGTVFAVAATDASSASGGAEVVTICVPSHLAGRIAAVSAASQLTLAEVPPASSGDDPR